MLVCFNRAHCDKLQLYLLRVIDDAVCGTVYVRKEGITRELLKYESDVQFPTVRVSHGLL